MTMMIKMQLSWNVLACWAVFQLLRLDFARAAGTTSKLQVVFPESLRTEDGYDHREAMFGLPPYGGSIEQFVYYANSTLCDDNPIYARQGFPKRDKDEFGQMEPWIQPFILMVDRGDCHFVNKVRNAQHLGAVAVLIADNVCLCGAGDDCEANPDTDSMCEMKEPIMADDGSGSDVTIPSYLMFKQHADKLKATLRQNTNIRINMSWSLPHPDDHVEYQLWTTPKDASAYTLLENFRHVAPAFDNRAKFVPHLYIYDGLNAGCQGMDGSNQCYNLCTNNGRYCSTDPDDDLNKGLSGADVITEGLRRLCIWQAYGDDGIGIQWWNYISEFMYRCSSDDFFDNEDCIKDAMKHSGVDWDRINSCMKDSGGLEANSSNSLLEAELRAREDAGVVMLPAVFVNNAPVRGMLKVANIFQAICAGYVAGSEPPVCQFCQRDADVATCVQDYQTGKFNKKNGTRTAASSNSNISVSTFLTSLFFLTLGLGGAMYFRMQQTRTEMRAQVQGLMSEYMLLDENNNNNVESVGYSSEMVQQQLQQQPMREFT